MSGVKCVAVANASLIQEVASLAAEIWREHYTSIIAHAQVAYMLEKFQSQKAIAEQIRSGYCYSLFQDEAGHAIGYMAFLIEKEELFLSKMYIHKNARGRGYGTAALKYIEAQGRQQHCRKAWLTVNKKNTDSIRVYQRWGFEICGPLLKDIGGGFVMDDYTMEKSL
jgi:diamine N-acetyltransferase